MAVLYSAEAGGPPMPMLWDREISAAQLSMATVGLLRAHGLPIDLQLAPIELDADQPPPAQIGRMTYTPEFHAVRREEDGTYDVDMNLPVMPEVGRLGIARASISLAPPMEGYTGWGIRVNSLTDDSREEHRRPAGVVLGGLARAVRAARDNSLPLVGYQWKGRYYAPGAQA